ncbi:hypothetical protein KSP40_PGU015348 [Platanthera guangdongensis]|uniref:Uncharacterized protein n=1 Tax=Platanthera guangdongensis TaxID=2320717 RepID=A0ABR2N509_9ASPA
MSIPQVVVAPQTALADRHQEANTALSMRIDDLYTAPAHDQAKSHLSSADDGHAHEICGKPMDLGPDDKGISMTGFVSWFIWRSARFYVAVNWATTFIIGRDNSRIG